MQCLCAFIQDGGVTFQFDGMLTAFHGTLTVVSADNLAAWNIGGYKALASAFANASIAWQWTKIWKRRCNISCLHNYYLLFLFTVHSPRPSQWEVYSSCAQSESTFSH